MLDNEDLAKKYPSLNKYTNKLKKLDRPLIGRKSEMMSVLAALMRPELCNVMLLAEPGSGKALANGTLIPVADDRGYVAIESLKVGDIVFDENGMPTRVLGVYPQGSIHAFKMIFGDNSEIICNNEHMWAARKKWAHFNDKAYDVVTLQDMLDTGIKCHRQHKTEESNWFIPMNKPIQRSERTYAIHPYAMGVFIGDGCYDCVFGQKSIDKSIPKDYLLGSIEQRYELLRGLMDTDGYLSNDDRLRCEFSTSSKKLVDDMLVLLTSLGIRATVTMVDRHDATHNNIEYTIHLRIADSEKHKLFTLDRYQEMIRQNMRTDKRYYKHYDDLNVCDVIDLNENQEMTCIYVDSDSHLFQAGTSHIVTHNTALVQGTMMQDSERLYLEVDLSKMLAEGDANDMASMIKQLFDEAATWARSDDESKELVLFIDEFHQIVQMSAPAVEALKPMLADSGTRGVKVIAATTLEEFQMYIKPNQALVERLQRINLSQADKDMTVGILKSFATKYKVDDLFYNDRLFELIYEYTNRYVPASSQPRKSIAILDAMVGWYRVSNRPLDLKLLADVIYESQGVNVAFRVDATSIKKELDAHVYAQEFATAMIEKRLQICVADLNNHSKPMSSFLFTGSTGVGKALPNDIMIPYYDSNGLVHEKLNGDIKCGDYVFGRSGQPEEVIGVFPQGLQDVYEMEFVDGRTLLCSGSHIWTYKSRFGNGSKYWKNATTEELLQKYEDKQYNTGRNVNNIKFVIPMNEAVQYTAQNYEVDPYEMGQRIEKCIPDIYKYGSIEQRWSLIQGLFDTNCLISNNDDISYSTSSKVLAYDIQNVLYSLGISSTVDCHGQNNELDEYNVHVNVQNCDKPKFFRLLRKCNMAYKDVGFESKQTDVLGIRNIKKLDYQTEMTCIMVNDDEHLYQAGQYIVTHNTEMTKQLANILFEDDRHLIRFDMTEYANEDSLERFRSELTSKIWERPYSIVLFDEVEKACAPVTRILLQVLDDARLSDANDREVSFLNCYIVLTTNAASEIYKTIAQYSASDNGSAEVAKKYDKLIRQSITSTNGDNKFPPELLGRIDCIVPFQPLSEETQKRIVKNKLVSLSKEVLRKHSVQLKINERVIRYLVEDNMDTDSDSGGARSVMSKLESEVTTAVARYINSNPHTSLLYVGVSGELVSDNKNILNSDAHIIVSESDAETTRGQGVSVRQTMPQMALRRK